MGSGCKALFTKLKVVTHLILSVVGNKYFPYNFSTNYTFGVLEKKITNNSLTFQDCATFYYQAIAVQFASATIIA
jgi:hypothetical protein